MSIDIRPEFRIGDDFDDESIPSVNMSNGNASAVLTALGFTRDQIEYAASEGMDLTPMDLTARLMIAGAFDDMIAERMPVREGRWIDAGTDKSYIMGRLEEIKAVAYWADQRGRRVSIY